jgi:hypothetical protein
MKYEALSAVPQLMEELTIALPNLSKRVSLGSYKVI